ncbi:MAG: AAA family ATPase [Thermomicrobiales bacterium]
MQAHDRRADEYALTPLARRLLECEGYLSAVERAEILGHWPTFKEQLLIEYPPPRIREVQRQVRAADDEYFKANPKSLGRTRPYVRDENWPEPIPEGTTEVYVQRGFSTKYRKRIRYIETLDGAAGSWHQEDPPEPEDHSYLDYSEWWQESVLSDDPPDNEFRYTIIERATNPGPEDDCSLGGILLSDVISEQLQWLWPGRIPLGKLTTLDGDPGLGKSALTVDLAARVSAGMALPIGEPLAAGGVILITYEDGLGDTIKPRLEAAGAYLPAILAARVREGDDERPFSFPGDIDYLRRAIRRMKATLVIIDPLMAALGGEVNSHRDQDIRRALAPLAEVAQETGAAIVLVRHLNKQSTGPALYRGGGSIGIIAAARSGLLVAADPDDPTRRVLARNKGNLGPPVPSLAFRLVEAENGTVRVSWEGTSHHSAPSLLALSGNEEERNAVEEAKSFLIDILSDPRAREGYGLSANEVTRLAKEAHISPASLNRAKKALGIKPRRIGFGGDGRYYWRLPKATPDDERP